MKSDDLLVQIGEFGPYQKRVYILVSLTAVVAAYQALSPVFLLEMNNYRCKIPSLANDTYAVQSLAHQALINKSVPLVVNDRGEITYSQCYLYNETSHEDDGNYTRYKCSAWVYDTSVIETTAFADFNMVCENEILRSHSNMIDFAGGLVGALTFGPIGDIIGRKKALIMSVLINCVANIAIALARTYVLFAVINFILGFTGMGMFILAFVLAVEFVGPSKRTMAGMVIEIFWCGGLFALTGIAYLIRQWRNLRLALGIPSVLIITYWWLIPESPRWLLARGRKKEAIEVIKAIAESNKTSIDESVLEELQVEDEEDEERLCSLFTTPSMIIRTVIIFFNWFAITVVYYGLSLNVGNLSGDIYLNFFLSSLMELIACILALVLLNYVGRKTVHCASMLVGGVACLATILPVIYGNTSTDWILICLAMVGKLGASAAFGVIFIFSAELFPTVVRQSAMGSCSMFEGIAGMVAPYIADLGVLVKGPLEDALPLIVFGCLTIAAGLLSLLLPETRNRKLPDTIHDAICLGNAKAPWFLIM